MPAAPPRLVGISLGNLESFVDGLGEFSQQFGLALAARATQLRERDGIELHFHVRPALRGCFGDAVGYLAVRGVQEFHHRQPQRYAVWHTLNQLNRYLPPRGSGQRIVTLHDLNWAHVKRGWSRWRNRRRLARLLARSDEVVTISRFVADDLRARSGWSGRLTTIHNGVRDLSATPRTPVEGLERPFLFHISRMSPSKNVEALLAMMARWPEMTLVLAGPSAPRNAELQARGAALGLRNLRVLTNVDDRQKAWLYAHCTAFLFPSWTEGFGLPPVEALHFGKPVFLSALTCLPEIGGDAAFYWDSWDPQAMRLRVEHGLASFGPTEAARARRRAAMFGWSQAADAYVDCYARALQR